jgi:hypothetical protein
MADLHNEFTTFHDRIALTPGQIAVLLNVRNAIRERIRNYFRETLKLKAPKFRGQGPHATGTAVNPIGGEYDIDDGVYLQHLDNQDDGDWPAVATVHQWLMNATDGHSGEKPMDKRTCVRVRYADQYHVDLLSYGELNGRYHLAVNGEAKWPHSDPLALTHWFIAMVKLYGEQLRRLVRYLKAWADFQSERRGKMPGGLILTLLAANHFRSHEKDDIALANTFQAISNAASTIFFVLNPVDINEALTDLLTDAQKKRFQVAIKAAADNASQAIAQQDEQKASILWRKQLGDRFPLVDKRGTA